MAWTYVIDDPALADGTMAPVYPAVGQRRHRTRRGAVYAVSGACAHMACPLSLGTLSDHTLTCACHERHIPFEYIDYDLADNTTQQRIVRELDAAGASGFPFVKIGNQIVGGYGPDRYTELLGVTATTR